MNKKLAVGLAMFLSGLGTQLANIQGGWIEVFSPAFVSGLIIQLSGFILTVWGGMEYVPPRNGKRTRREDYMIQKMSGKHPHRRYLI